MRLSPLPRLDAYFVSMRIYPLTNPDYNNTQVTDTGVEVFGAVQEALTPSRAFDTMIGHSGELVVRRINVGACISKPLN